MSIWMYVPNSSLTSSLAKHPFWTIAFLRKFCQISPFLGSRLSGFHFFGFQNNNLFYRAKSSALHQTPQPGGPGPSIYMSPGTEWPSCNTRHWVPLSSPSTIRRAAVEIFWPASTYLSINGKFYATAFTYPNLNHKVTSLSNANLRNVHLWKGEEKKRIGWSLM
jgi:hypothetical protein